MVLFTPQNIGPLYWLSHPNKFWIGIFNIKYLKISNSKEEKIRESVYSVF